MKRIVFVLSVVFLLAACREKVRVRVKQSVADAGVVATSTVPVETR